MNGHPELLWVQNITKKEQGWYIGVGGEREGETGIIIISEKREISKIIQKIMWGTIGSFSDSK